MFVFGKHEKLIFLTTCFVQITQDQVSGFSKDISKFKESFINEGPSSIGTDLDGGKLTTLSVNFFLSRRYDMKQSGYTMYIFIMSFFVYFSFYFTILIHV